MKTSILTIILLFAFCFMEAQITFQVENVPAKDNLKVGIRGSQPPLSWEKSLYLENRTADSAYSLMIDFPDTVTNIEYKFVLESAQPLVWEGIPNRKAAINQNKGTIFTSTWNVERVIDPSGLPLLTETQLAEDYEVIKDAILKVHPGLYRYNSKEEVAKNLSILKLAWSHELSYSDAFLALSRFITTIQCDHTSASYWNQESIMNSILHRQKNKLPFTFVWINNEMYLEYNASEVRNLEEGSEIVSINGREVEDILNAMLPYISADGNTVHNKIRKAEVNGLDFRFSSFDVLFPLLFPFEGGNLEIQFIHPNTSVVDKAVVKSITIQERKKRLVKRYPEFSAIPDDLWTYRMLDDSIGYLQLGSFGTNKMSKDWKKMLEEAFILFRAEATDVILDIRENQGGQDEGSYELQKYIFKNVCEPNFFQSQSRFLVFPEEVKPHIQTWDYWFYNLKEDEHYAKGNYFVFPNDQAKNTIKPSDQSFPGNLYLLTSGKNVSGAFYLANAFKECKLGTIIGQETGGNVAGINGGAILFLKPPNSRINVNLPIIGTFNKESKPNRGVKPDKEVSRNAEDMRTGRDTELEEAISQIMIKRGKNN